MDLLLGLLIGLFGAFFIFYSLQPQRPYPAILLNVMYQPWLIALFVICILGMFMVDERLAMVSLLVLIFFLVDIYYLGVKAWREFSLIIVMDLPIANALAMIGMQVGARFVQFNLTDAQKKLVQHPISQSLLLLFMFFAASRNIVLSLVMVGLYYVVVFVLLNESHMLNIYSRNWLMKEGFMEGDTVAALKEAYYKSVDKLIA